MASRTMEDLERELASCKETLAKLIEEWKRDRKQTVQLLRELANQIQKHESNNRIAKLTGASSSIFGSSLAIGGAVATVFTFGFSLPLIALGSGIAAAGGITLAGTELVNGLLRSTNVKLVEEALKKDGEGSRKLQDQLDVAQEVVKKINTLSSKDVIFKCGKITFAFGQAVYRGVETGMQLGNAGCEAGGTVFATLGDAVQVIDVAGIAFSALSIGINIYKLVSTSYKIHNGSVLKVVEDIRKVAQKLEDAMDVFTEQP